MADEKNGPLGRLEVIEFDQFDTSFAVDPADEGNARCRYMTLLAEPASPAGSSVHTSYAEVLRGAKYRGRALALKRLRPVPADQDALNRRGREAALFEEYRNMLAVSQLQGFPRTYGYGVTREGDPGILMEWVQGRNLLEARREGLLAQREDGGVEATTVAAVGSPCCRRSPPPRTLRAPSYTATSRRATSWCACPRATTAPWTPARWSAA